MARTYEGQIPPPDEGWKTEGQYKDADGVQWSLFVKRQDHSNQWLTCKVVANGRATKKANYWLVKNIETGKIGFARDYATMKQSRPELHAYVERVFSRLMAR